MISPSRRCLRPAPRRGASGRRRPQRALQIIPRPQRKWGRGGSSEETLLHVNTRTGLLKRLFFPSSVLFLESLMLPRPGPLLTAKPPSGAREEKYEVRSSREWAPASPGEAKLRFCTERWALPGKGSQRRAGGDPRGVQDPNPGRDLSFSPSAAAQCLRFRLSLPLAWARFSHLCRKSSWLPFQMSGVKESGGGGGGG